MNYSEEPGQRQKVNQEKSTNNILPNPAQIGHTMKGKKMADAKTLGEFGTFEVAEKVNPYIPTFEAFVKAAEKNPDTSWTVELDASKEIPERVLIAQAANSLGKTARLRSRDDSERVIAGQREKSGKPIYGGKVKLTFTLAEKHRPRRGKNEDAAKDSE